MCYSCNNLLGKLKCIFLVVFGIHFTGFLSTQYCTYLDGSLKAACQFQSIFKRYLSGLLDKCLATVKVLGPLDDREVIPQPESAFAGLSFLSAEATVQK